MAPAAAVVDKQGTERSGPGLYSRM